MAVVGARRFQPRWRKDHEGDDRRELTGDGEMFCVASDGLMKKRCGDGLCRAKEMM
jgi:hypothetical protein